MIRKEEEGKRGQFARQEHFFSYFRDFKTREKKGGRSQRGGGAICGTRGRNFFRATSTRPEELRTESIMEEGGKRKDGDYCSGEAGGEKHLGGTGRHQCKVPFLGKEKKGGPFRLASLRKKKDMKT